MLSMMRAGDGALMRGDEYKIDLKKLIVSVRSSKDVENGEPALFHVCDEVSKIRGTVETLSDKCFYNDRLCLSERFCGTL